MWHNLLLDTCNSLARLANKRSKGRHHLRQLCQVLHPGRAPARNDGDEGDEDVVEEEEDDQQEDQEEGLTEKGVLSSSPLCTG